MWGDTFGHGQMNTAGFRGGGFKRGETELKVYLLVGSFPSITSMLFHP